ncbi:hypothetical protein RSOL_313600 [Rhizoctonia solani AG-3 Rhs1AP]|uniref:Uncharacterized protein n=1 Tax=Rhizoctonia solani AG-3 Rhs1AP TaxID=1086054 RepID=A0A0A1ULY5_9AGAM|nr:hypothetical protein RSOL_313600 [Rhizoctonia solani AG-3 Rhs1AP]
MRIRKVATTEYTTITVPCPECGCGCDVNLEDSDEDEIISVSSDSEEETPVAKRPRVKLELSDSEFESKPVIPSSSIPPSSYPPTLHSDSDDDFSPWPTTYLKPEPASQLPKPEPLSQILIPPTAPKSKFKFKPKPKPMIPPPSSYPPTLDTDSDDDDIPPWPTTYPNPEPPSQLPKPEPLTQIQISPPTPPKSEPLTQTNIHQFFSQYSSRAFEYNPARPVMSEFYRMVDSKDFPKASQAQAKQEIEDALTMDFNLIYGTDVGDLDAWQGLCRVLEFNHVPDDLLECKRMVAATYVNIVDLIDTKFTGQPVRHFNSEKALAKYTRKHRKFFPRDNVNSGGLLKFLLRRIRSPTAATRNNPNPHRAPR